MTKTNEITPGSRFYFDLFRPCSKYFLSFLLIISKKKIQLTSEPTYEENDLDNDVRDVKVGHRRLQDLDDGAVVVVVA